ncbi:MAG: FkbM family methyltransferase [Alphaproteobacteria bacterium]|nr:FkbM family methyltransferase [Alphaproteobacteria bacterium]
MKSTPRRVAFVLAATAHGPLILSRFDYHQVDNRIFGVGAELLANASFSPDEIELVLPLLRYRRQYFGDGVVMVDCGANIGVHTLESAIEMTGWGSVIAIEAQERVFYALAGNIALNNCFNARAIHAAVGAAEGRMRVPVPDYLRPASLGSLEMQLRLGHEEIGQVIDYSDAATQEITAITLDSLALTRVDLIKIDVEGMEEQVLAGGRGILQQYQPLVFVEWIKSGKEPLQAALAASGYRVFDSGQNLLAVHASDPTMNHVRQRPPADAPPAM